MKCIYCEKAKTDVVNSRKGKEDKEVWRRRKCLDCGAIFTTTEAFSYDTFFVVKRNLTRKKFVYEKLFTSILIATTGGKGHDMGDAALLSREITRKVIKTLFTFKSKYVSTKDIIRATYHELSLVNDFFAKKYSMYSAYRIHVIQGKK
jgi:transcriptional regulator NrdR family protein